MRKAVIKTCFEHVHCIKPNYSPHLASRRQILEQECCRWKNHAANANPLIFSYNLMVPTSSKKKNGWTRYTNRIHAQTAWPMQMTFLTASIRFVLSVATWWVLCLIIREDLEMDRSTFHPLVTALYLRCRLLTRSIVTLITTVICFEICFFTFLLIKQTQNQFIMSNVARIIQLW